MTEINFSNIRTHDNSKNKAFEELCSQLARLEFTLNEDWKFIKKGGSADGGVECYWVLPDQSEYCWQAKFVEDLDSALNQVDSSVKQALDKHPKLVKYYVCLSIDFADSRQGTDVTQKVKWDAHLQKWNKLADEKGMQVEFIPWGKFELTDRLCKNEPEYIGRRHYWFNETIFSHDWFRKELDSVLKDAGPRYTPELHIALPELTDKFYAVSRDVRFYDQLSEYENELGKLIGSLYLGKELAEEYPDFDVEVKQAQQQLKNFKKAFHEVVYNLVLKPDAFDCMRKLAEELLSVGDKALHSIWGYQAEKSRKREEEGKTRDNSYYTDPFNHIEHYFRRLTQKLHEFSRFIDSEEEAGLCEQRFMLLKGDAGAGKTHTLYDFAEARLAQQLPTVMLLGQYFSSDLEPWTQLLQRLGLGDIQRDEFLGALDSAAEASNSIAVIVIDALNEGRGREFWPQRLTSFASEIKAFSRLALIASTRTTYYGQTVPSNISDAGVVICKHPGFEGIEYKATLKFFEHYQIRLPDTPLLNPEFSNPLFLKVFCQSINEAGLKEVPKGFSSLTNVFNFYLENKYRKIAEGLDYDPKENILPNIVSAFAGEMIKNKQRWIARSRAKELVTQVANDKTKDFQDSLFFRLLSEGVIIEFEGYDMEGKTYDAVGFAYERFSDHIIVSHLLRPLVVKGESLKKLRRKFLKHSVLRGVIKDEYIPRGWIEALCIQLPERAGVELFDITKQVRPRGDGILSRLPLFTKFYTERFIRSYFSWRFVRKLQRYSNKRDYFRNRYKYEFKDSIVWREPSSFTEHTIHYLNVFTDSYHEVLEHLLTVATVVEHPLNAKRFHRNMMRFAMPERDAYWGKHITYAYSEPSAVTRLVDWAWQENHEHISDDSIELSATAITWFLISSNRELRDFSTKALVNLFCNRLAISLKILDLFKDVDDLYLQERLYAAIYGAVLLTQHDADTIKQVASKVYELQFKNNRPLRHLLLRDYARLIIEAAIKMSASDAAWDIQNYSPPYQSEWPLNIPSKEDVDAFFPDVDEEDRTSTRGIFSIRFFVNGGDFERYKIQNQTHWYDVPIDSPPPVANRQRIDDALKKCNSTQEQDFNQALDNVAAIITETSQSMQIHYNDNHGRMSGFFFRDNKEEEVLEKIIEDANTQIKQEELKMISILGENDFRNICHAIYHYLSTPDSTEKFPVYDTKNISRWVCKRIFDLGWTSELFGDFDSTREHYDRSQQVKTERIGKKYAWIAFNEIKAALCDHLKFRADRYAGDESDGYKGAWQIDARDIDPTILVKGLPDLDYKTSPQSWWQPHKIPFQNESINEQLDWIVNDQDIPNLVELLERKQPTSNSEWLLLRGYYSWYEKKRTDDNGRDMPYRNLWLHMHCFTVKREHFEQVRDAIQSCERTYDWLPHHESELHQTYVGEFPFYGASESYDEEYETLKPEALPFPVYSTAVSYNTLSDYDGSSSNTRAPLPSKNIIEGMRLERKGREYDYYQNDQLAIYCPHTKSSGPQALLASKEKLMRHLKDNGLMLIWGIQGEKMLICYEGRERPNIHCISGFYFLNDEGTIEGDMKLSERN